MKANKPGFAGDHPSSDGWIVGFRVARAIAALGLVAVIIGCAPPEATRDSVPQASAPVSSGFEYFPAQYVNQAQHAEQHVQAF